MRSRCPSPPELERGFFSKDARVRAHVAACEKCESSWAQIDELAELAASLRSGPVSQTSQERRERVRTLVTSQLLPVRRRASRWPLGVGALAAALLLAAAILRAPAEAPQEIDPQDRGRIVALDAARFFPMRPQPDEMVRLVDGSIGVEVDHLEMGERFRVITGDGEVEVKGTTFDVTAVDDRLQEVHVVRGAVEVRLSGLTVAVLRDGESWRRPEPTLPAKAPRVARTYKPMDPPPIAPPPERTRTVERADPADRRTDRDAYEAGWAALRAGAFEDAVRSFSEVVESTKDAALREDARYFLAVSLARSARPQEGDGEPAQAIGAFETFLREHPGSSRAGEAAAMLGWMEYDRRRDARAAELFEQAIRSGNKRAVESGEKGLEAIRRRAVRELREMQEGPRAR